MKKIKLTKGKYAIVDDEDYPYLKRFSWQYYPPTREEGYVCRVAHSLNVNGFNVKIPLSHFILSAKVGYRVTHINKNSLDFRKVNLLKVSFQLSKQRAEKQKTSSGKTVTSVHKGVYRWKVKGKLRVPKNPWRARIEKTINGKRCQFDLGMFADEKEAALAYNKKAKELYGEYAYQNKI